MTAPRDMAKAGEELADGLGSREFVDVFFPGTKIRGRMRLVDRAEAFSVKGEALDAFRRAKIVGESGAVPAVALDDWNVEIAARHLAIAVRDPADVSKALKPLAAWRALDDDQIAGAWSDYQDLRDRLDPLGDDAPRLSESEFAVMREAVKKKESAILMSFGLRKLTAFALSSAEQPAS